MNLKFWNKIQIKSQRPISKQVLCCISEFFGTAILEFVGCMGCVNHGYYSPRYIVEGGAAFGLAVMMAVQTSGHISGSHINPAVSVAAFILGLLPAVELPLYILGQFLGALVGFAIIRVLMPLDNIYGKFNPDVGICAVGLTSELAEWQGALIELMLTFTLIMVAASVWDERNKNYFDTVPIRFGFTIMTLAIIGGPFTSSHLNPARSFAPLLLNSHWQHSWIFLVGPLSGGILAALLYSIFFSINEKK